MITPEKRAKERKKGKLKTYTFYFMIINFIIMQYLRAYLSSDGTLNGTNEIVSKNLNSFSIFFIPNDLKYFWLLLFSLLIYVMMLLFILADNTINMPEHDQKGSVKWADPKSTLKYRDKEQTNNTIFTQNVQISMDNEKTKKNNNTLVIGPPSAGKTYQYISPNLLNVGRENIVVNDVKGEIIIMHGKHLTEKGYDLRVLNTKDMSKSLRFNPLAYIRKESDILSIAKMLSEALGDKGSGNDQFWKSAKENLITACIAFVWERREAYPEQCNLPFINDLLRMAEEQIDEKGNPMQSDFDKLFEAYSSTKENRTKLSSRSYGNFKMNKDKTRANVLTTLSSMLSCLDIEEARQLLDGEDELHLEELATKEKIAIFLCSSDTDSTWNFLTTLAVSLGLNKISDIRDEYPEKGVDVVFWLDEFANGSRIKDCDKIVAVCRSRRIAMKIIIQSITQLEKLYKDEWKIIVESCDTKLILGANGDSAKFVSEMLGKRGLNVKTTSQTKQSKGGSWSINNNIEARELLTADEVTRLNDDAVVTIRGEYPIIDKKYQTWNDEKAKLMGKVSKGHAYERNYFFEPEEYRKEKMKRIQEKINEKDNFDKEIA